MINIDELIGHPHKPKKKLDEEFIRTHLMFLSLSDAQTELDHHFPGYKIITDVYLPNAYLIIDDQSTVVAHIYVS